MEFKHKDFQVIIDSEKSFRLKRGDFTFTIPITHNIDDWDDDGWVDSDIELGFEITISCLGYEDTVIDNHLFSYLDLDPIRLLEEVKEKLDRDHIINEKASIADQRKNEDYYRNTRGV